MLLAPSLSLEQQQGLIKNEFVLKKEDDTNGDIDWLLTEMMTDSQIETSTSNIIIPQQISINSSSVSSSSIQPSSESSSSLKSSPGMVNYLSSSVPVGNTVVFGGSRILSGNPGASIS